VVNMQAFVQKNCPKSYPYNTHIYGTIAVGDSLQVSRSRHKRDVPNGPVGGYHIDRGDNNAVDTLVIDYGRSE
jgi:hypothetical protein